jgi:hypothetical protein
MRNKEYNKFLKENNEYFKNKIREELNKLPHTPEGALQACNIASSQNLTLEERQLGLDHFFNIFPDTYQDQTHYMDFSGANIANIIGLPSGAPLVLEGTKMGGVIENQLVASDLTNANLSDARINGLALIDCRVRGLKIDVSDLENMLFAFSPDGHSIILINPERSRKLRSEYGYLLE